MPHRFRDLSIALKLNLVQGLVLLTIILAATGWTASHLREQLTHTALDELRQINRLAVSMLDSLRPQPAQRHRAQRPDFPGSFDKQLELVEAAKHRGCCSAVCGLNDRIDVVDAFTAKGRNRGNDSGRQGDDFLRTATSLKKEDGARSTGTLLGTTIRRARRCLRAKPTRARPRCSARIS
jgi:hypothetical protein